MFEADVVLPVHKRVFCIKLTIVAQPARLSTGCLISLNTLDLGMVMTLCNQSDDECRLLITPLLFCWREDEGSLVLKMSLLTCGLMTVKRSDFSETL